jgi:endonuclease VIII
MPEGPEIRRAADALARVLVGASLVRIDYFVPALQRRARALRGARVQRVYSRSKALLIAYDCGLTHYSHNQLYGEWAIRRPGEAPDARRLVRVELATDEHVATLYSATQIALLDAQGLARHPYLGRLGPDVLDPAVTVAALRAHVAQPRFARSSLAALLLDQRFVAGLGNYLRSDILFAARLPVSARMADLDRGQRAGLVKAIVQVARQSYRSGGATNDLVRVRKLQAQGVDFDDARFLVYGREGEPCYGCGRPIRRVAAGGRGLFFCPCCQAE